MGISIENLMVKDLKYGEEVPYQRPLDGPRAKRMADNLTLALLGVPEVSRRKDGTIVVVDGQHRVAAAALAQWKRIRCRVHVGLSYREEVALYRRLNNDRKRLERIDDYKALLEQEDPDTLALDAMVRAAGFVVGRGGGPNRIGGVQRLQEMYVLNEALVTRSLVICRNVWREYLTDTSLSADLIGGVHLFMHHHPEMDPVRLEKRLANHRPRWWVVEADGPTSSGYRAHRIARLIEHQYNSGLRASGRRLEPAYY